MNISDGYHLPRWWGYRHWLRTLPMAELRRMRGKYYNDKFGYRRNGDVYEIDRRCVGAICTVVILAFNGFTPYQIANITELRAERVELILKNYKYYVGWHNSYLPDGRRIYPPIREVQNIHTDFTNDVIEC